MSLINQMLMDLEKRHVSGAERGALPSHVRSLPEEERDSRWRWVAAGAAAAVAVLAGGWALIQWVDLSGQTAAVRDVPAQVVGHGPEPVAAAAPRVTTDVPAREGADQTPPPLAERAPAATVESSPRPAAPPITDAASVRAEPIRHPEPIAAARVVAGVQAETGSPPDAAVTAPPPSVGLEAAPSPAAAAPGGQREQAPRVTAASRREAKQASPAPPASQPAVAVATAKPPAAGASPKSEIQKQVREPTPHELAENEHRKATALLHQGRYTDAQAGFQAALNLHPAHHGARQALVGLLIEGKNLGEAERVLQEGTQLAPAQIGFAMALARIQVDRQDNAAAVETLRRSLEHAQGSAEYLAFLAALLQRQGNHAGAIEQFRSALRMKPGHGVWLLGLGMSLQALNRNAEAQDAYRHARIANNLSPDLQAFADQRLRQLQ